MLQAASHFGVPAAFSGCWELLCPFSEHVQGHQGSAPVAGSWPRKAVFLLVRFLPSWAPRGHALLSAWAGSGWPPLTWP